MKQKILLIIASLTVILALTAMGVCGAMYNKGVDQEHTPTLPTASEEQNTFLSENTLSALPSASESDVEKNTNRPQMPVIPDNWQELLGDKDLSELFPGLLTSTSSPSDVQPGEDLPVIDFENFFGSIDWSQYSEEYKKYLEEWKEQLENGVLTPDEEIKLPESDFTYDEESGNFSYSVRYTESSFSITGNILVSEDDFSFSIYTVTVDGESKELNFTVTKTMLEEKLKELEESLKDIFPVKPSEEIKK